MFKNFNYFFRFICDILFPQSCLECSKYGNFSYFLCDECISLLNSEDSFQENRCYFCSRISTNIFCESCLRFCWHLKQDQSGHYALEIFSGRLKRTVYQIKFYHRYEYKRYWAKRLADLLEIYISKGYYFVIVPTKKSRHILHALIIELRLFYDIHILNILSKYNEIEQKHLNVSQRVEFQKNNIFVKKRHKSKVMGKKWLVIDDIYTTGATLFYCCRALKQYGALDARSISLLIN